MKEGGKLPAKKVKQFLNASYEDKPPEELDGWILDKSLSNKTGKVYYNPATGEAVVAHRGTKGARDWLNNAAYATGAYKLTTRYKRGKKLQDAAEKKYGDKNISTLGHSQGAILARELGADTKEIINVNPAYKGEKPKKNEYNVRSSTDVVSALYAPVAKVRSVITPKKSKKHDITIKSKSALDPLGEHSYDILDRMGDKEIGVGAGIKIIGNCIMKTGGRRTLGLGYDIEDIDWIRGGARSDSDSSSDDEMMGGVQGLVGTPYLNQGTNPYGVRGGKKPNVGKAFKKFGKQMSKGFEKMAEGTEYINPMMWAIKDKKAREGMTALGDVAYNYALPAVVEAGKPLLDVAAASASTALTGNPILGKVVADTLWKEMVEKPGYDPRKRQKSKELGQLSGTLGKVGAMAAAKKFKPAGAAPVPKKGAGVGRSKSKVVPTADDGMPTLAKLKTLTPEERRIYKINLDNFRGLGLEADDIEEMLEEERVRFRTKINPISRKKHSADNWGNANEVGQFLALLTLLKEKKGGYIMRGGMVQEDSGDETDVESLNSELQDRVDDLEEEAEALEQDIEDVMEGVNPNPNEVRVQIQEWGRLLSEIYPTLPHSYQSRMLSIWNVLSGFLEMTGSGRKMKGGVAPPSNPPPSRPAPARDIYQELDELRQDHAELAERLGGLTLSRAREFYQDFTSWLSVANDLTNQFYGEEEDDDITEMMRDLAIGWNAFNTEYNLGLPVMVGSGRPKKNKVDFEDIKWGTFTRMFQEFKREHPRARAKDLEQFANYVVKNKKKFSPLTLKKANFYKNVLMKGGANGDESDLDDEIAEITKGMEDLRRPVSPPPPRPPSPPKIVPKVPKRGKKRKAGEMEGTGRKKGGASPEQIGKASVMRTYSQPGTTTFYVLSDVVHSADKPGTSESFLFTDRKAKPDDRVGRMLDAMTPSYLRQMFFTIEKDLQTNKLPDSYNDFLLELIEKDPNVVRTIKGYNDNWGLSVQEVRGIYKDIERLNPRAAATAARMGRSAPSSPPVVSKPPPAPVPPKPKEKTPLQKILVILSAKNSPAKEQDFLDFLTDYPDFDADTIPQAQRVGYYKMLSNL